MGFLDKAKKLAEQAQSKLDEVQKQVSTTRGSGTMRPSGPAVEYDKHGRPTPQQPQEAASPPHGDPLAVPPAAPTFGTPPAASQGDPLSGGTWSAAAPPPPPPAPPVSAAPPVTPGVPPTAPPSGPPAPVEASSPPPAPPAPPMPDAPGTTDDDRHTPSYAPPKMTGGDPLAG